MDPILTLLLSEPAWVVYAVVGLVVLLEGALPAGILLPGEATALLGGASVTLGRTDLVPMVLVVVAAAVAGDGLGFRMGRSTGPRLLRSRLLRSRRARLEDLRDGMARRGPFSLVAARWTALVRTVVPALAGASGMSYRRFVVWNGLGGVSWGATSVVLGALAGGSYAEVQAWLGGGGALLLGLAVAAAALVALHRRRVAAAAGRFGADAPVADVVLAA